MQTNIYKLRMDAMSWCFENDYKVVIVPVSKRKKPLVKLNIVKGNKIIKRGKDLYAQNKDLALKINNIYVYLYKKLNSVSFS